MKTKYLYNLSRIGFVLAVAISFVFVYLNLMMAIQPFGANYTEINSTTAPVDPPQSIQAQAGNVTELNIDGYSTTQTWQGYFGNVTGTIMLGDGSDNVMYNWSLSSPEGEIYASVNDSISWGSVMCFNFTATGDYGDDSGNIGNTSWYGTNLTGLESSYNISPDDVDGVDETFLENNGHDEFFTAQLNFTVSECLNMTGRLEMLFLHQFWKKMC